MMNSVLIVTNFDAGRKKAIKYKKRVVDFVLKYTTNFKFVDLDELKVLDVTPFDTIFAMGGDGTVNRVLPYIIGSDKVLGIIPCGTANLLAAKLGLSYNIDKTLKIMDEGNIKLIDVMDINGMPSVLRCGFGWDSDIICKTPQSLKNKFGYFAYFIAGILFALRLKKKKYQAYIDGKDYNINASCIIAANAANMYRKFFSLAKDSYPDDGLIDLFILKTANPILFFIEFLCVMFHIYRDSRNVQYIKAKTICINDSWIHCHIDGEKQILKENPNISIKSKSIRVFAK